MKKKLDERELRELWQKETQTPTPNAEEWKKSSEIILREAQLEAKLLSEEEAKWEKSFSRLIPIAAALIAALAIGATFHFTKVDKSSYENIAKKSLPTVILQKADGSRTIIPPEELELSESGDEYGETAYLSILGEEDDILGFDFTVSYAEALEALDKIAEDYNDKD